MQGLPLISKCALALLACFLLALIALAFYDTTKYDETLFECEIICVVEYKAVYKNVSDAAYFFIASGSTLTWIVYLADYIRNRKRARRFWILHPLAILQIGLVLFLTACALLFSIFGYIYRLA